MANANRPAGLIPVKYLNGARWNVRESSLVQFSSARQLKEIRSRNMNFDMTATPIRLSET
jgi:hypothetical protein